MASIFGINQAIKITASQNITMVFKKRFKRTFITIGFFLSNCFSHKTNNKTKSLIKESYIEEKIGDNMWRYEDKLYICQWQILINISVKKMIVAKQTSISIKLSEVTIANIRLFSGTINQTMNKFH